ncbi:MAG TPA: ferritin-like domain-containing protein [Pyrinomonadaceae bacterium]|nr:ferritin-like domain-containing protein [Pyrinomonadaceae bacterium]
MFETEKDVLDWYERQPRAITKDFVDSVPWNEIKDCPLKPAFIPVLLYMRDVEYFTDIYYKELLRTPTGRDVVIRKFMDRWSVEELQHAELLNRFLAEAGISTSEKWKTEALSKIPWHYTAGSYVADYTAHAFGQYFHGAHMVWGAINEITTLQGYRRLAELAEHPVLSKLLVGIMQEESIHANFYWSIARLKLAKAKFSRRVARFVIDKFWSPVGQGPKSARETNYVMATLFRGTAGLEVFNKTITNRIERLPGFDDLKSVTNRVAPIVQA